MVLPILKVLLPSEAYKIYEGTLLDRYGTGAMENRNSRLFWGLSVNFLFKFWYPDLKTMLQTVVCFSFSNQVLQDT